MICAEFTTALLFRSKLRDFENFIPKILHKKFTKSGYLKKIKEELTLREDYFLRLKTSETLLG